MTVLSLFDGMSCGQIALRELGIKIDKYFASEIDKHAIAQTQLNFPNTISRFAMLYRLHPKAYKAFMNYTNNGITYREALRAVGVVLPDENRQLSLFDDI